jgi:hypothetical protein
VTVQRPGPRQAPLQLTNLAPLAGLGRRRTRAPFANEDAQRGAQAIPVGELNTRPGPRTDTLSLNVALPNRARTVFSPSIVTVHDRLRPAHAPVQPRNAVAPLGRASRRTVEPRSNSVEHAGGHSRPSGSLVTTPDPPVATTPTVSLR